MAERINAKSVTVAASVLIAAPVTTDLTINPGELERLDIIVPAGPSGLLGFQVLFAGVQLFPEDPGQWFVADGVYVKFPLHNQPTDGRWSVRAYNTDVYAHTLQFWLLVNELRTPAPLAPTLLPIG
jgi:hypothetical protein